LVTVVLVDLDDLRRHAKAGQGFFQNLDLALHVRVP